MTTEYDHSFGKKLRSYRMSCKFTQDEFSHKLKRSGCDLSRHDISEIENGKRYIYPHELKSICYVLDIALEELMP